MISNNLFPIVLLSGCSLLWSGCANELIFMERTKAAVSVDFATNPAEPVEVTAGYKRTILAMVPPKQPTSDYANPRSVHQGEALSLISSFDLQYKRDDTELVVKNGFVSGKAASIIAKKPAEVDALFGVTSPLGPVTPDIEERQNRAAKFVGTLDKTQQNLLARQLDLSTDSDVEISLRRYILHAQTQAQLDFFAGKVKQLFNVEL